MNTRMNEAVRGRVAFILLILATGLLFSQTQTQGAFSWFESSRNAMSGAFVRDLILAMPFGDPVGWAEAYYAQYPSLVVLFYPPMLHVVLGLAFIPLGVSHLSAMIVVFAFYFAMILGLYTLGRRFFGPLAAAGVALAYSMSPEVAQWGRQVLLEVPMMAFLVWCAVFGLRFMDSQKPMDLYFMAFFGLGSLYTKQTGAFVILLLGLFFLVTHGKSLLRKRYFWATAVVSVVALIPLAVIQLKFGTFNATVASGHPDGVSGFSFEGLSWYLVRLPGSLGWWVVAPAIAFLLYSLTRLFRAPLSRDAAFIVLWFMAAFLFFTIIDLKETRHGLPLYLPVVFAAVGFFSLPLLKKWQEYGGLALGVVACAMTLLFHPSPHGEGYNAAADYIAEHAPPNAVVLFSGHKDGDFVFNIRAHDERGDITVVRADKLFLGIKILPHLGLNAVERSRNQITEELTRYGISYVVSDEESFSESEVIRNLISVLQGDGFERVAAIPVTGLPIVKVENLVIYRNKAELPAVPEKPSLELRMIDKKIN